MGPNQNIEFKSTQGLKPDLNPAFFWLGPISTRNSFYELTVKKGLLKAWRRGAEGEM